MNTDESRQYTICDIYDKNGVLLIPKDCLLTPEKINLLNQHHIRYQTTCQAPAQPTSSNPVSPEKPEYFLEDIFDPAGNLMVRRGA